MNDRDVKPAASGFELASLGSNETVVFRRASPFSTPRWNSVDAAADEIEQPVSYYQRAIQTIRFLNPNPRVALASAIPELSPQGLIKVHGFAAFTPREARGAGLRRAAQARAVDGGRRR